MPRLLSLCKERWRGVGAALVLLAGAMGAGASPASAIVGGQEAPPTAHPYMVSVQWSFIDLPITYQPVCGGTVLDSRTVVTASNCLTELPFQGYLQVKAGTNSITGEGQVVKVVERIEHPAFEGGRGPHDIAVLKPEKPLTYSERVQPAKLPSNDTQPTGQAQVVGWGSTSTTSFPLLPKMLQQATVPLIPFSECRRQIDAQPDGSEEPLTPGANICTGGPAGATVQAGPCTGDQGGPLLQGNVVIGIVSWDQTPCGQPGRPSVYTNTSHYLDFISTHMDS